MNKKEIVDEIIDLFASVKKVKWQSFEKFDLKPSEYTLIRTIYTNSKESDKFIKITELSNILDITPAAITHVINSLEDKELIERITTKDDRRVVYIKLTDAGINKYLELNKRSEENLLNLVEYLGNEDSNELIRILNKVIEYKKGMK